jgi:hypothetical protein
MRPSDLVFIWQAGECTEDRAFCFSIPTGFTLISDEYFVAGFKHEGFECPKMDAKTSKRILNFCREHRAELRKAQTVVEGACGMRYPLMKLVDMHFWQIGFELEAERKRARQPKRRGAAA